MESPSPRGNSQVMKPFSLSSPSLLHQHLLSITPSRTSHLSSRAFTSWPHERQRGSMTCHIRCIIQKALVCVLVCAWRAAVHASSPLSTGALCVRTNRTHKLLLGVCCMCGCVPPCIMSVGGILVCNFPSVLLLSMGARLCQ